MPRHPDVQTLARCTNEPQAQLVAAQLDVEIPADMELLGEEPHVIRVRRVPGGVNVQSWPRSALDWDVKDAADVPFEIQEADVAFP